jgi:hypothetical protein
MIKSARREFSNLPNDLILRLKINGFETFESISNGSVILPKKEKEKEKEKEIFENENENENENEIEIDKNYPSLTVNSFLKLESINNPSANDFLNAQMWFETKAMQLGEPNAETIIKSAKDFLIDIRDRDLIEGKNLIDLRSHFISWFKKKRENTATTNKTKYLMPEL